MRLGVDLGGSKIEILALNDNGEQLHRQRIATPQNNYRQILAAIHQLVRSTENQLGQSGSIGICTPGSISPQSGRLRNSNSICLNDNAFKEDLENILQRQIRIANDANCFALSEAIDGSAQQAAIVFGVIIGTGCGAGIVINKQIIDGPNAISGEWGHNPLPWPENNELNATSCWCGRSNCIETFLSGPAMTRDYKNTAGEEKSCEEIVQQAKSGEPLARQTLWNYQRRMAKSLAHIINILDPHTIVLGGGLSNIKELYTNVPELWQDYVFSDTVTTQLVAPRHGDSSGARGAAWLWKP